MSAFSRMLLAVLFLAELSVKLSRGASLPTSSDVCMRQWFMASGTDNASASVYTDTIRQLTLDERNVLTNPGKGLLPVLLNRRPGDAKRFLSCLDGSNRTCAQLAPCRNGGQCVLNTTLRSYYCNCQRGWTGVSCEKDIDECRAVSHDCVENSRCVNTGGSFHCECGAGFTGDGRSCVDIDECASSPCQGGGTCHNLRNMFRCTCKSGTTGNGCQTDMDECASSPCLNGATCHDGMNGYRCQCLVHYEGTHCDTRWLKQDYFEGKQNKLLRRLIKMEETMEKRLQNIEHSLGSKLDALGRNQDARGRKLDSQGRKLDDQARKLEQFRKSMNFLHGGCSRTNAFCEQKIDGGGWSLVWKHSYLQVPRLDLANAKTYSSFSKPCTDLNDGWCNVPNKQLPGVKEQMIVAYHKGIVVYAYKSPLNPNLGKTEHGARLMMGWSRVVDKCRRANWVRPDVSRQGGNPIIFGIAFDKNSPGNIAANCDTVHSNYSECRWQDCGLPKSISVQSSNTQMTVAFYVR